MISQSFKFYNRPYQQEDYKDCCQSHTGKDSQGSPQCLYDAVDGAT